MGCFVVKKYILLYNCKNKKIFKGGNMEEIMLDSLLNRTIPKIKENIHFWMVRTQGGAFYSEFYKNKFVAFGWNYIDKQWSYVKI